MTRTSTERQKRSQNVAPVLVIISGNSLVFSGRIITSTGFLPVLRPQRVSTSSGKKSVSQEGSFFLPPSIGGTLKSQSPTFGHPAGSTNQKLHQTLVQTRVKSVFVLRGRFLLKIDDHQITYLICVRLRHLLYDFFRGVFWVSFLLFSYINGPKHPPKKVI